MDKEIRAGLALVTESAVGFDQPVGQKEKVIQKPIVLEWMTGSHV
mgnify:CR=1 FL=1